MAPAPIPSSTDPFLADSSGGGMVSAEGEEIGDGRPGGGPEKEGGNPSQPGSLLELLRDLWEMLGSILPLPRLNRP
jgi:hypothetical protein